MNRTSTRSNMAGWAALVAIALGILLIGIGIWMLNRPPRSSAMAVMAGPTSTFVRASLPTSLPTPTSLPSATAPSATASPTSAATTNVPTKGVPAKDTISPTLTATPLLSTPVATQTATPDGLFSLVVVHSNDTWGYTRPCG